MSEICTRQKTGLNRPAAVLRQPGPKKRFAGVRGRFAGILASGREANPGGRP